MAGRVPGAGHPFHPVRQRIARAEWLEVPGRLVGRHRAPRHVEQGAQGLRCLRLRCGAEPVVHIALRQPHGGVGVGDLAIGRQQAAHMVGVRVCQQDVVHVLRLDAGRAQVGQHLPHRGAKAVGGAGVDQDQIRPAAHQVGVDGGLHAILGLGHMLGVQPLLAARQVELLDLLHRYEHHAVKQRGDLHVANHLAVHARHLGEVSGGSAGRHRGRRLRAGQRGAKQAGGDGPRGPQAVRPHRVGWGQNRGHLAVTQSCPKARPPP